MGWGAGVDMDEAMFVRERYGFEVDAGASFHGLTRFAILDSVRSAWNFGNRLPVGQIHDGVFPCKRNRKKTTNLRH